MKKITIYGLLLALTTVSCNKTENVVATQPTEKQIVIQNPNEFIGKHKAKAMVLGVFHFSNPGLDGYKPTFPFDILASKRQKELDILLEKIAAYKPTKILVEVSRIKGDSAYAVAYNNYLKGTFTIDDRQNEIFQIGFKLAKKLGHNRVYCSDAVNKWCGAELDWDNYDSDSYLKAHGQYDKSVRYDYDVMYRRNDSLKTVQTLTEHLMYINHPSNRLKDHQAYLTGILEGAGDNYLGADAVSKWYQRNLRIFANAYDVTNFDEEERILMIYGSGHVWQLRQFFTDSPDYEYIEPNNYLTP